MKHALRILVIVCLLASASLVFAQDDEDDDLGEISAPQTEFISELLYQCHVTPTYTNIIGAVKTIRLQLPVAGAKKLIFAGYGVYPVALLARITHLIRGNPILTASSLNSAFNIDVNQFSVITNAVVIHVPDGLEKRVRLRTWFNRWHFTYTCWARVNPNVNWSGAGVIFVYSINASYVIEETCRPLWSNLAWQRCP